MARSVKGLTMLSPTLGLTATLVTSLIGKKGKRSKHHQVVSKDGKTMKVTTSGQDAQGNNINSTEVYHKTDK